MIQLTSDWSKLLKELDRIGELPGAKGTAKLNALLGAQFEQTQAQVHVQTSSLKKSGAKKSTTFDKRWQGEISYGGPSTGPKPMVTYAIYERERGVEHDYMSGLMAFHPQYVQTIKDILHG
jgi:hypothetical protein